VEATIPVASERSIPAAYLTINWRQDAAFTGSQDGCRYIFRQALRPTVISLCCPPSSRLKKQETQGVFNLAFRNQENLSLLQETEIV
jgi:hypothetical protein